MTDEATRQGPRPEAQVETVMSLEQSAPTIATHTPVAPAVDRTLEHVGVDEEPVRDEAEPSRRGPAWLLYAAAILLALLVVGAWMFSRQRADRPVVVPQTTHVEASTMTATAATIPIGQSHLGINAFPWAKVTSVRNLDNGQWVEIGSNLVTPAPLDLAPGRYEITLSNPNFANSITRTVSLTAGRDETLWVSFADPATASVPDFGGGQ